MKYALVTGGSRGIGRAICLKLAAMGHPVIINYQSNKEAAEETKQLIETAGGKAELTLVAEIAGVWKHWIDTGLKKTIIKVTGVETLSNGFLMIRDAHKLYEVISNYMKKHPEAGTSIIEIGDSGAIAQIEKELGNIMRQKNFRDFVEYNYESAPMLVNGSTVTKVNYDTWHIVQ